MPKTKAPKERFSFTRKEALVLLEALRTHLHHDIDRSRDFRQSTDPPFSPTPADLEAVAMYLRLNQELDAPLGDAMVPEWAEAAMAKAFLASLQPPKPAVVTSQPKRGNVRSQPTRRTGTKLSAEERREIARRGGLARAAKAEQAREAARLKRLGQVPQGTVGMGTSGPAVPPEPVEAP